MNNSNWPFGVDYSHPNHTLKTPRASKYSSQRGWPKHRMKTPISSWLWAGMIAAVASGFGYLVLAGAGY